METPEYKASCEEALEFFEHSYITIRSVQTTAERKRGCVDKCLDILKKACSKGNVVEFVDNTAVCEGFLSDWYQASVTDEPTVWTDEHISEVCEDFYLIPKEAIDKLRK